MKKKHLMTIAYLAAVALILFVFLALSSDGHAAAYANETKVVATIEELDGLHEELTDEIITIDILNPFESGPPEEEPCENFYYDIPLSFELQDYLREKCEEYSIPIEYALGIMTTENASFDSEVINGTNDYGLWQINICNHDYIREQLGKNLDFTNPYDNIEAGVFWISRYYPRYGFEQAAMCYHHGEGYAKKLFKEGNINDSYSQKVMANMSLYL